MEPRDSCVSSHVSEANLREASESTKFRGGSAFRGLTLAPEAWNVEGACR